MRVCVCVCSPSELFYTERAHLRTLKVLDSVFYQRLKGDGILPPEDIKLIFINLEEIIQLHGKHAPCTKYKGGEQKMYLNSSLIHPIMAT